MDMSSQRTADSTDTGDIIMTTTTPTTGTLAALLDAERAMWGPSDATGAQLDPHDIDVIAFDTPLDSSQLTCLRDWLDAYDAHYGSIDPESALAAARHSASISELLTECR